MKNLSDYSIIWITKDPSGPHQTRLKCLFEYDRNFKYEIADGKGAICVDSHAYMRVISYLVVGIQRCHTLHTP